MLNKTKAVTVVILASERSKHATRCRSHAIRTLESKQVQQTEIIDILLFNSSLYETGSFYVLMWSPWMGGEERDCQRGGEIRKD